MKTKDFDFEQRVITVPAALAKNTHARILPLSNKTAKAIKMLIKEISVFKGQDFIFCPILTKKLMHVGFAKELRSMEKRQK